MKNVMAFFLLLAFSANGYAINILKPIVKSAANDCEVGFSLTKPMHGYLLSLESTSKDGCGLRGFVAQISCRSSYPNPRTDLSHADRLRRAQCCEAIQNRGTDLKLRHLSVKVS